jgi:hypothetical protein
METLGSSPTGGSDRALTFDPLWQHGARKAGLVKPSAIHSSFRGWASVRA